MISILSCFCAEVIRLSSLFAGMLHVTWEMLVGNEISGSSVCHRELKQDLYSVRDTRISIHEPYAWLKFHCRSLIT